MAKKRPKPPTNTFPKGVVQPKGSRDGFPEPEYPWDRMPEESDKAWAQFLVYRDLPVMERSLRKAARIIGGSHSSLLKTASRFSWVARARNYDQWRDRQAQIAEIEAIAEMKKRHIQIAMNLQGAAALALQKIIRAEQSVGPDGKPGPLTLKPGEVKDLAELGMKIERLNRGEPESLHGHKVELEAHDKRRELRKLLENPRASAAVQELADRMLDDAHGNPKV